MDAPAKKAAEIAEKVSVSLANIHRILKVHHRVPGDLIRA
jgi:hypothetical protein